jgi:glycosyltransferase involved in cell wall biosynthesis
MCEECLPQISIVMSVTEKVKLLVVYPASDMGGGPLYILPILRFLPRSRYDIHVAVTGKGRFYQLLEREHYSTCSLKIDYSPFSFVPTVLRFRRFLSNGRFNLIHAHTAKAGLLTCIAAIGLPAKIIYTGHVFGLSQSKPFPLNILFARIERFLYRASTYSTVLSRTEYDDGIAKGLLDAQKTRVVSMSIDVKRFLAVEIKDSEYVRKMFGIDPNAFVVGMIGRLTFQKDPESFVRAAALISSVVDGARFLWVGDGDLREAMVQMATEHGLSGKFIVTGQQNPEDMPKLISAIDLVLFTSRFEGLPLTILEAMALGKYIVSADVGSIRDVVQDGSTGWLFKSGDFSKAASIACDVYRDRDKLSPVRHRARAFVSQHHSPTEKMSREFEEIYEAVLVNAPQSNYRPSPVSENHR